MKRSASISLGHLRDESTGSTDSQGSNVDAEIALPEKLLLCLFGFAQTIYVTYFYKYNKQLKFL